MTTRRTSRAMAPLMIAALAVFGGDSMAQNGAAKQADPAKTEASKAGAAPAPATGHEGHHGATREKPKAGRESGTPMTITGEVMARVHCDASLVGGDGPAHFRRRRP